MKAVVCHQGELTVESRPELTPEKGQALLRVSRCGICGSDLHARIHSEELATLAGKAGYSRIMSQDNHVVMGHEFVGVVESYGPGSQAKYKPGTRVAVIPLIRNQDNVDLVGFSEQSGGAYAERVVVDEAMLVPVPDSVSDDVAALAEPLAVGLHAVNRSEIKPKDVAVVIGCGPVGLLVIAALKAQGVKTILASDFSPARRQLAEQLGATRVFNPAEEGPFDDTEQYGFTLGMGQNMENGLNAVVDMGKLPWSWWHTWRLADKAGATAPKRPVIFECVGAPGMLNRIIADAPLYSRIVEVGVCMESDKFEPSLTQYKEIDLCFAFGYTPLEFRDTLQALASGKLNIQPLITGVVGLDGVKQAFEVLANPEHHAKIMVDPQQEGSEIKAVA